ncbi:MAG: OmpH family outer membrane protein [Gammaproteobacteria bacterium]|nr:OmpH family outer membrane protein [Gammaproteobacteria bacterium]
MNRKLVLIACGVFLGLVSLPSSAQQDLKIGYVNINAVFSASPQMAEAQKAIQKEFTAREEKIKALQSEAQALREKYNREAITMGEKELMELQEKMITVERKFKWEQSIAQEDLKIRRQQILAAAEKDIQAAILKIAQNGKFDLILSEGVIFSSERVNLSDEVLEQLKKK